MGGAAFDDHLALKGSLARKAQQVDVVCCEMRRPAGQAVEWQIPNRDRDDSLDVELLLGEQFEHCSVREDTNVTLHVAPLSEESEAPA